MADEFLLRAATLVGFVLFVPIAGYYRVRAHSIGEKLDRRQEGMFLLIAIRLAALFVIAAIITFIIDPEFVRFASLNLPLWLRWIGVALAFVAGCLWVYTFHHLGRNLTDTVVARERAYLVKTGPYHYVRHPFYVAVLFIAIANGLVSDSGFILLGGLIVFVLLRARTDIEERKLVEKFGDEYRVYMRTTGRFFPKWR